MTQGSAFGVFSSTPRAPVDHSTPSRCVSLHSFRLDWHNYPDHVPHCYLDVYRLCNRVQGGQGVERYLIAALGPSVRLAT